MNQENFNAIEKIINEGSLEDLELVKKMILNAISERQTKKANIYDVLDILNLDLRSFLQSELPQITFRSFKPGAIIAGVKKIRKYDKSRNILVYDIIGIDESKLVLQTGIGQRTVEILERLLNKHGLSLNRPLTFEERSIYYKNIDENKGLKAM